MSPPSRRARSREIESPSPVPPYLRWVLPSAWRKASKIRSCWLSAMPMPVSCTAKATPPASRETRNETSPLSVNLSALESRFFRIWPRRCPSVFRCEGTSSPMPNESASPFCFACGSSVLTSPSTAAASGMFSRCTSTLPASIFERSRMSLMSVSRSLPAPEIVCAYLTCSSLRLPCGLSASSLARMSVELSGVRSSWLMLARNSVL